MIKQQENNKMAAVSFYLSIITLNVNKFSNQRHCPGESGGGGGGGVMNWEIGIDIYTLICIKK